MKVTIVPIVIGALGAWTKGLLKGLEDLEIGGRVETIQTTALLRTARILKRVLETWGWVGLGWVGFHGISTIVGHLMPNPFLCK